MESRRAYVPLPSRVPTPTSTATRWFDGHLDLAFLAEVGRDMHTEPAEARGRLQPVAVTLPSLRAGGVFACCATIFTEPADPNDPESESGAFAYPPDDVDAAYVAGMRQMKLYHAWAQGGAIDILARPDHYTPTHTNAQPLRCAILMENADPISTPDDLAEWAELGLSAVGLAWARPSRYARGNLTKPRDDTGLTDLGRAMVRAIDALGLVHDVSHLSDHATDELLELATGRVIASHSNARALFPGMPPRQAQRHLRDETIAEIARRGGVIGVNLFSPFLDAERQEYGRATIEQAADHACHLRDIAGTSAAVALGSDMDGGFGADRLPEGIDRPADLAKFSDALCARGWTTDELAAFERGAWCRFWNIELPD